MVGLKLRRNEELTHSDFASKAPKEKFSRGKARRGTMSIDIILECQY